MGADCFLSVEGSWCDSGGGLMVVVVSVACKFCQFSMSNSRSPNGRMPPPPSELACGGPTTSGRTRKGGRQTEWPKGARGTEQKPNLSSRND